MLYTLRARFVNVCARRTLAHPDQINFLTFAHRLALDGASPLTQALRTPVAPRARSNTTAASSPAASRLSPRHLQLPLVPPLPRQHQQPHQQAVALAVATGGNGCGGGRGLSVALGGNGGRVAAPREPLAAAAAAAWHPAPPLPARAPLCGCERSWWGYLVAAARFGASERVGRGDAGPRAAAPTPGWWRVAVPAPPPLFPLSAGGALAGLRRPVKLRSAHAAPPLSCPSAASPRVALVGHRGVQHVPVGRGGRARASAGGWGEGGMWKRRVTGNGEVACEWGWGEPTLR